MLCNYGSLLALTITGLVYGWGENKQGQACPQCPLAVCVMPKKISLPIGETASDIAAIGDQVILLFQCTLFAETAL